NNENNMKKRSEDVSAAKAEDEAEGEACDAFWLCFRSKHLRKSILRYCSMYDVQQLRLVSRQFNASVGPYLTARYYFNYPLYDTLCSNSLYDRSSIDLSRFKRLQLLNSHIKSVINSEKTDVILLDSGVEVAQCL